MHEYAADLQRFLNPENDRTDIDGGTSLGNTSAAKGI